MFKSYIKDITSTSVLPYSSVGIATSYRLYGRGSIPGRGLQSSGYRVLFPTLQSGRAEELTTHLHLTPRLRPVELYFHCPVCLHGIVHN